MPKRQLATNLTETKNRRRGSVRRGATAIEYALIISVLSVVVTVAAQHIGAAVKGATQRIDAATGSQTMPAVNIQPNGQQGGPKPAYGAERH